MTLTVIVSTYNSPRYLALVLEGLSRQKQSGFECVIADDGSGPETAEVVKRFMPRLRLVHSWQADEGFRLAANRNRALSLAAGDIIAFLDGDCIPAPEYTADVLALYRRVAPSGRGAYLQGHRVILGEKLSRELATVEGIFTPGWLWSHRSGLSNLKNGLRIPLPLRGSTKLKGIRGCSMVFSRQDLEEVNGFDEDFKGWGHEDRDIASRLYRIGVRRFDARGRIIIYHLYHPEHNRTEAEENLARADSDRTVRAGRGLRPIG